MGDSKEKLQWSLRQVIDLAATLMVIVVCAAVLWTMFARQATNKPSPKARAGRPEPPVPTEPISVEGAQTRGSSTARIAFVEFSDFECPFCGRFARDVQPMLDRMYIKTGDVLMVFVHFPLEEIHPNALTAAVYAECAGQQGRFWEMHDLLFSDQKKLDPLELQGRAKTLGLDIPKFGTCLSGDMRERVRVQER